MNLNKITLIGRLTKDPELRALPSGTKVVNLSVATGFKYKKDDEWTEKTTYHNVVAFGKQAETIATYFVKGQEIFVEGRQENDSYEKTDGTKGYRSQVIMETFQFGQKPAGAKDREETEYPLKEDTGEINLDDIPF